MASSRDNLSDPDLVGAVRGGDRAGFATLVDRHLPAVYAVALRILGHAADAEDITQDAFLRALERLDQFDMGHSFRNWLLKITTNLAINQLRSRGRQHAAHQRLADAISEVPPASRSELPGPEDWQTWLARLEPSQRAAIVLFHFEGLSYGEVAAMLEMPINTVRSCLHRGRRRLRDVMTRGGAYRRETHAVS